MISMEKRDFTLYTVLSALRKIISREFLYNGRNTTCIICSSDLELALGMKFLHITEVKDVVLTQMEYLPPIKLPMMSPTASQPASEKPKFDIEGTYMVTAKFLRVIRQVPGCLQDTNIFKYRKLTELLSQYILDNKDNFFDNRNIRIAHVSGDALGYAFEVDVFHRTQVIALLRKQLLPTSSPGMVLRSGRILPPHYLDMDYINHTKF